MSIKNYTDEQLLLELFSRNEGAVSPSEVKFVSPHSEFIVGIGCDHSVAINIDDEALYELNTGTFNVANQGLNFGSAISAMKDGKKVARKGWNGRGMWLAIQMPDTYSKMQLPYIYMNTAQSQLVPWLASQADMLADDWCIVE